MNRPSKNVVKAQKKSGKSGIGKRIAKNWALYLLMLPAIIIMICFTYIPMGGIVIAFKDFNAVDGIWDSSWAGLRYFQQFFRSYNCWDIIRNTVVFSLYTITVTFPLPIAMALLCNQMYAEHFKKFFQVSTYLPHFISTVVMCGMIILFLSPSTGVIAKLLSYVGITMPNIMSQASAFPSIFVWTEAWQHVGWDSILYIAALSAVDPSLYEAATVDGANKWQKIRHIDIPMLLPTITIMLILRMGSVMSVGFEKVYLLQNSMNMASSEIISTYVYKMGLVSSQYSLSAAVNLFNNLSDTSLV